MTSELIYTSSLFDTLGIFASFNLTNPIWDNFEKYAVKKLEESTLTIKGILYSIDELETKEAIKAYEFLNYIIPTLENTLKRIKPINDKEFIKFKEAAMDFFKATLLLNEKIHLLIHKKEYNTITNNAFKEAKTGKLKKYKNSKELYRELGI